MVVLGQRIDGGGAVAAARGDDRQFAHEVGRGFQNDRHAPQVCEGFGRVSGVLHPALTLAVIALPAGLHQHRRTHFGGRGDGFVGGVSR